MTARLKAIEAKADAAIAQTRNDKPPPFYEPGDPDAASAEPPSGGTRYRLLRSADLRALPPMAWRVRGVMPERGLGAIYGPSGSGKSFLGFDMGATITEGGRWFGHRVRAAPVVYVALEGEAGIKQRAEAWEISRGRTLPDDFALVLQPFSVMSAADIADLSAVVPDGAVVFIDTLNRAAPTADENTSADMGQILQGAKTLQAAIDGLVVLIHHSGKDLQRGLRGHSSLYAALDAAIEVSRDGEWRSWRVEKTKDGQDGESHGFRLRIETVGTDDYGDALTSCVVETVNDADRLAPTAKLPQGGNQRLAWDALRDAFADGVTGKDSAPPLAKCIELETAVGIVAAALTVEPARRRARAREALTGLINRSLLGCHEGWIWKL